ncbi:MULTISPECIES: hypothetical protein [Haloferax]|nr:MULTISPECIES: hypothetical protein [Haloferax]ELZ96194.1 hypothetical protein C441_05114 [Haloferax sulfurifontis ATCC BAA-897]EMA06226.1 hypothetical protein C438_05912 [Haloferax denitrificans ATCC 35960]
MYTMSSDDFSVHQRDCDEAGSGIPITSLPDEVTSLDDLPCSCWDEVDSFDDLE